MESYKSVPWGSDEEGRETDISWGNHGGMACRLESQDIWSHTCTKAALWLSRDPHLVIAPKGLINQPQLQYRQT